MRLGNPRESIPLLSTFYLFIVYSFGVFSEGVWSDDYAAIDNPSSVALHAEKDGRLLYGFLIHWFFSSIEEVGQLKYIRLFGLLGILLLNHLVICQLLKVSKSSIIPFASSIAFTLPSFQLSTHWAIAFCISWSAYLSILGLFMYRKKPRFYKIVGMLLCIFSLLLYPLMTFFVFSVLFAEVLVKGWSFDSSLKSLREGFMFVTFGGVLSFVLVSINLSWRGLKSNDRVELVALEDIPEKLLWFATRPFALSFRPFQISSPGTFEMLLTYVAVFSLISLLSYKVYRNLKSTYKFLFSLVCFIAISILPLLLASQNQIDIRFIGSSSWIVLFSIIFLLVRTSTALIRKNAQKTISFFVILIIGLYSFVSINYRFTALIKPIYSNSTSFIFNELNLCSDSQISNGVLVVKRTKPWPSRQLLGFFSQTTDLASDWVPIGAVKLVLIKNSKEFFEIEFTSSKDRDASLCYVQLDKF
jgi:hypothetical protein